ncbi:MAG: hypothetical protein KKD44_28735 [Proteobacteria bacterium]|nr:hypothetical protein [Pseudomonadota bacterium]
MDRKSTKHHDKVIILLDREGFEVETILEVAKLVKEGCYGTAPDFPENKPKFWFEMVSIR